MPMKTITRDLRNLLFPCCCKVCGQRLAPTERHLCTACLVHLPLTHYEQDPLNPMMQRLLGYPCVQRASALFFYHKDSPYTRLIHSAKYFGEPEVGRYLGRYAAQRLLPAHFFDGIDRIVPLPLARSRMRRRGYNQCHYIAQGVADVTGIPLDEQIVRRSTANRTQTSLSRHDRWLNVQGIFSVPSPGPLAGSHLLLVDDLITTGSTLLSCIDTIAQAAPDARITVLTLACDKLG